MNIRHNQFIEIVLYRLKEIIPSFFVKMFENIRKSILNDRITPSEILQRDIFIIDWKKLNKKKENQEELFHTKKWPHRIPLESTKQSQLIQ